MNTLKLTYNNKPLNLFFGMEFMTVFVFELGHEFTEVDIFTAGGTFTGEYDKDGNPIVEQLSLKEYLLLSRDIIKSCAIAYANIHGTEVEFSDLEFQSMYLSPLFDKNKFLEVFVQTMKAFIPQPEEQQVKKGSKKK